MTLYTVTLEDHADLFKLFQLGHNRYDCLPGPLSQCPKHIVVGKQGQICYMGKQLTSQKLHRIA